MSLTAKAQIRYMQSATLLQDSFRTESYLSSVQDSVVTDSLYQVLSRENYPVYYYRNVKTSVCFDNKCRLLRCKIYWNVTGRYLGFELPKKEYLSKARHKPFKKSEYERLNALLADGSLPLGNMSYSELAPELKASPEYKDVDAVSSATAKNVADYIVPGAAYTTYKMWHVVNGPTQSDVQDLTRKSMSSELALLILDSPEVADKIWVLNNIENITAPSASLTDKILSMLSTGNYTLTERAIHSLSAAQLQSDTVQVLIARKLSVHEYSVKRLILSKLQQATSLNLQAALILLPVLASPNPELVGKVLDMFLQNKLDQIEICKSVAALLRSENDFIARKAYAFLQTVACMDENVQKEVENYQRQQ